VASGPGAVPTVAARRRHERAHGGPVAIAVEGCILLALRGGGGLCRCEPGLVDGVEAQADSG
jgi:hypothetical protein